MDSGYAERLKGKGWSDLMIVAFERAATCAETDLGSLEASLLAQYVCLIDTQVTIAWLEDVCKARGYEEGAATARFEEEVLKPIVFQHETRLQSEQRQIDQVVDRILLGSGLPPG